MRKLRVLHYAYCTFSAMLESDILELQVNCTHIKDSEHKKRVGTSVGTHPHIDQQKDATCYQICF